MFKVSSWFLWVVLSVAIPGAAIAGSAEPPGSRTLSPYFFIENGDQSVDRFPLKETKVTVAGRGRNGDRLVFGSSRWQKGSPAFSRASYSGLVTQTSPAIWFAWEVPL
jgi:hypothetical protein